MCVGIAMCVGSYVCTYVATCMYVASYVVDRLHVDNSYTYITTVATHVGMEFCHSVNHFIFQGPGV